MQFFRRAQDGNFILQRADQAMAREASAARCMAMRRVDSPMRLMGTGLEK